jgi:hypothetical protein
MMAWRSRRSRRHLEVSSPLLGLERADVAQVVVDAPLGQPLCQRAARERIVERLAPDRAVRNAGLRQRPVQVQHADQARPLAAPVRERENRRAVPRQAREHVARVLPHRFDDDDGCRGVDGAEGGDAGGLAVEEAVALGSVHRMATDDAAAEAVEHTGHRRFQRRLGRPAHPVGS